VHVRIVCYCSVLECLQVIDEELRKLQTEAPTGDPDVWKAHLEQKATLEMEQNAKAQLNREQRSVSKSTVCIFICAVTAY